MNAAWLMAVPSAVRALTFSRGLETKSPTMLLKAEQRKSPSRIFYFFGQPGRSCHSPVGYNCPCRRFWENRQVSRGENKRMKLGVFFAQVSHKFGGLACKTASSWEILIFWGKKEHKAWDLGYSAHQTPCIHLKQHQCIHTSSVGARLRRRRRTPYQDCDLPPHFGGEAEAVTHVLTQHRACLALWRVSGNDCLSSSLFAPTAHFQWVQGSVVDLLGAGFMPHRWYTDVLAKPFLFLSPGMTVPKSCRSYQYVPAL